MLGIGRVWGRGVDLRLDRGLKRMGLRLRLVVRCRGLLSGDFFCKVDWEDFLEGGVVVGSC